MTTNRKPERVRRPRSRSEFHGHKGKTLEEYDKQDKEIRRIWQAQLEATYVLSVSTYLPKSYSLRTNK